MSYPAFVQFEDVLMLNTHFFCSLGSTRFLKVCRAHHVSNPASLFVVKVFVIQDLSINLREDRDKLLRLRQSLEGCVNCLPFQRVFVRISISNDPRFSYYLTLIRLFMSCLPP